MLRRVLILLLAVGLTAPAATADPPPDPVITVPPDMTVEAQSFAGAAGTYTASAVDFRGRPVPVECSPPSGSVFSLGQTRVTCTATDDGNRTSTKRFDVTVVDRTAPTVSVPPAKTVRTTSKSGAVVAFEASATDLVDGPVAPTCAPASGTRFPLGSTQVSCTAADRRANVGSASFAVTLKLVRVVRVVRRAALLSPLAGARLRAPPLLAWRVVPGAIFYNVQLFRKGRKILSVWPWRPRVKLRRSWTHEGQVFRLRPGTYVWYVWPSFGLPERPRWGRMVGRSSFRIVRGL